MGIGMGVFHSAPIAALLWFTVAGGFYTLARTIFGRMSATREHELKGLIDRLEEEVQAAVAKPAPQAKLPSLDTPAV
jgi:hypothetical protein